MEEMQVWSLSWEDPLEKEMETHSSILAWKIHGQKSLAGCSLRGHKGSDVTEHSNKKGSSMVKNPPANEGDARDGGLIPGSGRPPGVSMATYASIFSGKFHGHRSLVGCSPWGSKESDVTEWLSTYAHPLHQKAPSLWFRGPLISPSLKESWHPERGQPLASRNPTWILMLIKWLMYGLNDPFVPGRTWFLLSDNLFMNDCIWWNIILSSTSAYTLITSCCSVAQSCPTLCNPMDCSTPGFPVLHYLLELSQTRVHCVGDAIQPSHPLPSPSPPAFNLSQQQGLFQWVSSSHQVAKVLEFQLQHQSFQWIFRVDLLAVQGILKSLVHKQKHQFFSAQPSLWSTCHIHMWLLEKP